MGNRDRRGVRGSRSSGSRESSESGVRANQILDRFTSVDDKLDETVDVLQDVVQTNAVLIDALADITDVDITRPERNDRPLVAAESIEPEDTVTTELTVPNDGYVSDVYLSFPTGANQSVGIGVVGTDGEALVPFGPSEVDYIALDGETVDFELDYNVQDDETITVRFANSRSVPDDATEEEIAELTTFATAVVVVTEEV